MRVLFWALVIPGAIITYFVIGVLSNILLCVCIGVDWRSALQEEDTFPLIIFWPLVLVVAMFFFLPMNALHWVLEKIAEGNDEQ